VSGNVRKRWITGTSIVALLLACAIAEPCIRDYKRFNKADRLATGHVIEVDPGDPGEPISYADGGSGGPGQPPSSRYQFEVNGITYDGRAQDQLVVGETVPVRYNSSQPRFNYAEGDVPYWKKNDFSIFLIGLIGAAIMLVGVIRDR